MTLRLQLIVWLIAIASFPIASSGTEIVGTISSSPRVYTETEIAYIRGLNCDTLTTDAKARCLDIKKAALSQLNTATGNTLEKPVRSQTDNEDRHLPVPPVKSETGSDDHRPLVSKSGTTLPKPQMGTGTDMEHQIKGIGMAIGKLTPTDREALIKMIREYLTAKGITLGAPEVKKDETERKGWDGSIKGKKTDTEIQAERAALLAKAKAKRETMRKEYVGHVTLMK